jgi:hypothetical protein
MSVIDEIASEVAEFQAEHGRKPAQMLLTPNDKDGIGRLRGSEFSLSGAVMRDGVEQAVTRLFGVPIVGWNAIERQYYSGLPAGEPLSTRQIQARVTDWIERLNALFDQLDQWSVEIPGARIDRSYMDQQIEGLMEQYKVNARKVPTFEIFVGKNRTGFIPSALWIVGANGRVNVTTNYRQYALVDLGGSNGTPSNWRLVLTTARNQLAAFDKSLFLKVVEERA